MRKFLFIMLLALLTPLVGHAQHFVGEHTQRMLECLKAEEASPTPDPTDLLPQQNSVFGAPLTTGIVKAPYAGLKMSRGVRTAPPGTEIPNLYGYVISSKNGLKPGFYRLPRSNEDNFVDFLTGLRCEHDAVLVGDILHVTYAIRIKPGQPLYATYFEKWNVNTGEKICSVRTPVAITNSDKIIGGWSYNPVDGKLWCITGYGSSLKHQLCTIDYNNDEVTITAKHLLDETEWNGFSIDKNGIGYMLDHRGHLYRINLESGEKTEVGFTEIVPYSYLSSYTHIDHATGRMFWATQDYNGVTALYEIDKNTALATRLVTFPGSEVVSGLSILPSVADKAPGKATDLSAEFADGNHTGTLKFTAPTTHNDGSAAAGTLNYKVLANDTEVKSGAASYGESVTLSSLECLESGRVLFTVILSNENGESAKAQCYAYVGNGVPKAPQKIKAVLTDNEINLSWDSVKQATDNRFFNPQEITYTVKRICGEQSLTLAENTTATTIDDTFTFPADATTYWYEVQASFKGEMSAPGKSNHIVLGAMSAPYSCDFTTGDKTMLQWNIFDVDNDGATWNYDDDYGFNLAWITETKKNHDDWMITPRVRLKAGTAYRVTLNASSYAGGVGVVEVYYGAASNPESMATTLIPKTKLYLQGLGGLQWHTLEGWIVSDRDQEVCVGIHATNSRFMTYVRDFEISAGTNAKSPAAPTEFTAEGELKNLRATLSLKAPTLDMAGNSLNSITRLEVLRGDSVVKTFSNPTPGSSLSFTDQGGGLRAEVIYTAIAYNEYGTGLAAKASTKVGFPTPQFEQIPKQKETSTFGTSLVSWQRATQTVMGQPLGVEDVKYNVATVVDGDIGDILQRDLTTTEATVKWQNPDAPQSFAQFAVQARSNASVSYYYPSESIPVGKPYTDYSQNFEDASLSGYILGYENEKGSNNSVGIATDRPDNLVNSVTGDRGFLSITTPNVGNKLSVFSGKISLQGIGKPSLTFYACNIKGDDSNLLSVKIRIPGQEWEEVMPDTELQSLGDEGWNKVCVSLARFAGKVIEYRVTVTAKKYNLTYLDDFKVGDVEDRDMALNTLTAPASMNFGEKFNITMRVVNEGMKEADGYTLRLKRNGKEIAVIQGQALPSMKTATHTVEDSLLMTSIEPATYSASVEYANDANPANNIAPEITVAPIVSKLPGVYYVQGSSYENVNKLEWGEPEFPEGETLFDFEDGNSWEFSYPGWTFIDADGFALGSLDISIPAITVGKTKGAFFLFDAGSYGEWATAHSGKMYLTGLFRSDFGRQNDWAISPELDGSAQTITFWARNIFDESKGAGSFKIYYSTTGKEIADFKVIEEFNGIVPPDKWTKYSVNMPKGAKYFAIRHNDYGGFMLMYDDFTMTLARNETYTLKGYDVYRDGVRLTGTLLTNRTYSDTKPLEGIHIYGVVPVYEEGSGRPGFVSLETNGVEGIGKELKIGAEGRYIVVEGAEGMTVQAICADGKLLFNGTGTDRTVIPADPGVYMVRAGMLRVKVLVK